MKWAHPLKGRTIRQALADELGIQEHQLQRLPPIVVCYEGTVSWVGPHFQSGEHLGKHYHSWDSMKDCLKYGFDIMDDLCVVARDIDPKKK